jgi:hypothetical protein
MNEAPNDKSQETSLVRGPALSGRTPATAEPAEVGGWRVGAKQIALLPELVPQAARIAALVQSGKSYFSDLRKGRSSAGRIMGIKIQMLSVPDKSELVDAL